MYEVRFFTGGGAGSSLSELLTATGLNGIQSSNGNAIAVDEAAVNNMTFNCLGNPPERPQGTQVTYASGARGPTPNPSEFVVETITLTFPPIIVGPDNVVGRYYLTEAAAQYLDLLARVYKKRPYLALRASLGLTVRRIFEENDPDNAGADASALHSAVDRYPRVLPKWLRGGREGMMLDVDILAHPQPVAMENYV